MNDDNEQEDEGEEEEKEEVDEWISDSVGIWESLDSFINFASFDIDDNDALSDVVAVYIDVDKFDPVDDDKSGGGDDDEEEDGAMNIEDLVRLFRRR